MHIACILCCRFCRHNSVQSHRFCVSYKHNDAFFTQSVTFEPSYDSYARHHHALHTLNLVWPLYIYVHCALWVSAQRCTLFYNDNDVHHGKDAPSPLSLLTTRCGAKMFFTALDDVNRVVPLRTTASTNHRAPWWQGRTFMKGFAVERIYSSVNAAYKTMQQIRYRQPLLKQQLLAKEMVSWSGDGCAI